jgi:tetratricopeptide (TPR) repeat protein
MTRFILTVLTSATLACTTWAAPLELEMSPDEFGSSDAIPAAIMKTANEAYDLNMQGLDRLEGGDLDGALELFQGASEKLPGYSDALNNEGVVYFRTGDIGKAQDIWQGIVKHDPEYALGHFNLGVVQFYQHSYEQAMQFFQAAVKRNPKLVEGHVMSGRTELAAGNTRAALDDFKKAHKVNPKHPGAWGYLAYGLIQVGDTSKALNLLKEHQDHAGALELLGVIAARRGNLPDASRYLQESVAKGGDASLLLTIASVQVDKGDCPGALATVKSFFSRGVAANADAYLTAGIVAKECGQTAQAQTYLEDGLKQSPDDPLIRNNLGRLYFYRKKYEEAEQTWHALSDTATDPDLCYLRALTAKQLKNLPAAEKRIRSALSIDQKAEYYDALGAIQFARGQRDAAETSFDKALSLDPSLQSAKLNLSLLGKGGSASSAVMEKLDKDFSSCGGNCRELGQKLSVLRYNAKDLPGAASALERVPDGQRDVETYRSLSLYYRESHEWDKAIATLTKAQNRFAGESRIDWELAEVYLTAGRYTDAIDLLTPLVDRWKDNPWRIYYQLGYAYLEQNNMEQAQAFFEKSLKANPQSPAPKGLLAYVYSKKGDTKQARDMWEKSLQADPSNSGVLINLGLAAEDDGKYSDALDYYKRASAATPDDKAVYVNIGNVYMATKRPKDAEVAYRQALSSSKRELAAYNLFVLAQKNNDLNEASQMQSTLLREFPNSDNAQRARAEFSLWKGDTTGALSAVLSIRTMDPADHYLAARVLLARANTLKATAHADSLPDDAVWRVRKQDLAAQIAFAGKNYQRARELWESSGDTSFAAQYNLALADMELQDYEAALAVGEVLCSHPGLTRNDQIDAFRVAGNAALAAKDWEKAGTWYEKLAALRSDDPVVTYNLAVVAYNKGDVETAWKHYQNARRLNPTLSNKDIENRYAALKNPAQTQPDTVFDPLDAQYNDAVSLQSAGKTKKAEEMYRAIIKKNPNYGRAWNNLGALLAARAELSEAEKCYLNGIKKSKAEDLPECYANLVNLYIAIDRVKDAKKWVTKGLTEIPGNELLLQMERQVNEAGAR